MRFTHIENCTHEVCREFKAIEEVEEIIGELNTLDEELASLRAELATRTSSSQGSGSGARSVEYEKTLLSPPDVSKAKRLLTARRNAIKSVKEILTRTSAEDGTSEST